MARKKLTFSNYEEQMSTVKTLTTSELSDTYPPWFKSLHVPYVHFSYQSCLLKQYNCTYIQHLEAE